MFDDRKNFYFLPGSENDDGLNKLKSRIQVYFSDVEFIPLHSESDKNNDELLSALKSMGYRTRVVLDSPDQIAHDYEEFINTYIDLYEHDIWLAFYRSPYLDTDNIISLCTIFMDKFSISNEHVSAVLRNQYDVYLKNRSDYRNEKNKSVTEARRIRELTGTQEENELRRANAFKIIEEQSKDFGGTLSDVEIMKKLDIGRNTYYRYKRQLKKQSSKDNI